MRPWLCIGRCIGLSGVRDASLNEEEFGSDVESSLSAHFGRSLGGFRSDGQPVLQSFLGIVSDFKSFGLSSVFISLILRHGGVRFTSLCRHSPSLHPSLFFRSTAA